MAKKPATPEPTVSPAPATPYSGAADILREPAETRYADQLEALKQNDADTPPTNWKLSPRSVLSYITGGKTLKATIGGKSVEVPITRKFFGDDGVVERSIVTLASERALLLVGEPGTGKCVKGDTLVVDTRTGKRMRIDEVYRTRDLVVNTLDADYQLRPTAPIDYLDNGMRPCYRLTTHTGRAIEVTANHPFLTLDGWKPLRDLKVGDRIALSAGIWRYPHFRRACDPTRPPHRRGVLDAEHSILLEPRSRDEAGFLRGRARGISGTSRSLVFGREVLFGFWWKARSALKESLYRVVAGTGFDGN
jgi:hypothetical protein